TASPASSSTSASPPSSWTRRSAASPTPVTPPWTCGWTPPAAAAPRTCWPPPTSGSCAASCATTARSGSPAGSPPRASGATRRTGGNPAKRTFQALRIAVNDELAVLERTLPRAIEALVVGGRIVVLAYHSLEDRAVKRALARGATSSAPPDLPVEPETHRPYLRLLTRGAEEADAAEVAANPRAASVRLRAAERTRPTPDHM